jgi:hypothetical protein
MVSKYGFTINLRLQATENIGFAKNYYVKQKLRMKEKRHMKLLF